VAKKKSELIKKVRKTLVDPKVAQWYATNLEHQNQGDTLVTLKKAVDAGDLTLVEALDLAFVVGLQWHIKVEGVN